MLAALSIATTFLAAAPTLAEHYQQVRPYFSPPPGGEVAIDEQDIRHLGRRSPMELRGYIGVNPPNGTCLTVQVHPDRPDFVVCKQSRVPFLAGDMDRAGRITWQVSRPGDPVPVALTWRTPHRIADVVPAGERLATLSKQLLVLRCEAKMDAMTRKITLTLPQQRPWIIHFPEKDIPLDAASDAPNLYVHAGPSRGGLQADGAPNKPAPKEDFEKAKENSKKGEPVQTYWAIPKRHAFSMSSANFSASDAPGGLPGECRYTFKGPPDDPKSGAIECHTTDLFDVVLVNLTCAGDISRPQNH